MAISLDSLRRGGVPQPERLIIYGPHGVGKTSIAAGAPSPVIIQTEDGLGMLDVPTFGVLRDFRDVTAAIGELANGDHDFQTVIVDSLDWLEPLIWSYTCELQKWNSIEDAGYGKGYLEADKHWRHFFDGMDALRTNRNMGIILIAHTEVKTFEPPDSAAYDRYQPKLHKRASALAQENADGVFLVNYRVSLVKDDPKDKDSRQRGVGAGQRVLYTEERPSHLAKNRWRMQPVIALPDDPDQMWPTIAAQLPFHNQPKAA